MLVSHLIRRVLSEQSPWLKIKMSYLQWKLLFKSCTRIAKSCECARFFLYCKPRLIRDNLREKWKKGDHKFAIWCGNSTTYLAKSDLSTKKPQPICFGQASLRILIAKRHVICTHIGTKSSYVHIHILRNMNVWRSFPLNIHTFTTGQVKDMNH